MLEYLILNNRIESALKFKEVSSKGIQEQLLNFFNKGKRQQFFELFGLLRQESKLQFYLRVYFLVYSIHPTIKVKNSIPEEEINSFKQYLNNKGAQLAKTNQFLQFYALPFIKKHLEHPAFKNLFKKQWITNLKDKLSQYLQNQIVRMKQTAVKIGSELKPLIKENIKSDEGKIRQMENINKELFEEVRQFTQKYVKLEQIHKAMAQKFNYHMMQSQSKWFQITKQLVNCSKNLIQMILRVRSNIVNQRKFMKIQRRIQKYQRFVNRKLDDLLSQSQDISIFDRHSANELSCTVTPYTQKNMTTFLQIEQYIPTNINQLKQDFQKMKNNEKRLVLQGLSWRIIRSKDKIVQRQNIVSLFLNDLIGVKSGEISHLIFSKELLKPTLQLLEVISLDRYGLRQLFIKGKLYKDLVNLLTKSDSEECIYFICNILQQLTFQQDYNKDLIQIGLINIFLNMLKQVWLSSNENIVENIIACLLNFSHMKIGIDAFEKEEEVYQILSQFLNQSIPPLIRVMVIGILYCLAKRRKLFQKAQQFKLLELIEDNIYANEDGNMHQLQMLAESYRNFSQKNQQQKHFFDQDCQIENQSFHFDQNEPIDMEELIQGHEFLTNNYMLMGRQAIKQTQQVRKIINQFIRNVRSLNNQKGNQKINGEIKEKKIKQTPVNTQKIKQQKINQNPIKNNFMEPVKDEQFKSPPIKRQYQRLTKNKKQNDSDKSLRRFEDSAPSFNNYIVQKNTERPKPTIQQKPNIKLFKDDKIPLVEPNRIKKSNSAQRNIVTSYRKEKYYESELPAEHIGQFKPVDEKQYRSPQLKPSREEVLKQLNEQLRALKHVPKESNKPKNHSVRQNSARQNHRFGSHKNLSCVDEEGSQVIFQSRPKIRRTPPKQ